MRASEVRALYEKFYEGQELVTLLGPTEGVVDVRDVEGTHGWTMGGLQVHSSGKRVVAVVCRSPLLLLPIPVLTTRPLHRVRSTTCSRAPRPSACRTSTSRSATRSTLASPRPRTLPPSRAAPRRANSRATSSYLSNFSLMAQLVPDPRRVSHRHAKCPFYRAPTVYSFMWTLLSRVSWSKPGSGRGSPSAVLFCARTSRAESRTIRAERDAAAAVLDAGPGKSRVEEVAPVEEDGAGCAKGEHRVRSAERKQRRDVQQDDLRTLNLIGKPLKGLDRRWVLGVGPDRGRQAILRVIHELERLPVRRDLARAVEASAHAAGGQ